MVWSPCLLRGHSSAISQAPAHKHLGNIRAHELGGVAVEENYFEEAVSGCDGKLLGGVCVCRDWRAMWRFITMGRLEYCRFRESLPFLGLVLSFRNVHFFYHSVVDQTAYDNRWKRLNPLTWQNASFHLFKSQECHQIVSKADRTGLPFHSISQCILNLSWLISFFVL